MRGLLAVALLTPVLVAVASTPAQGVDEWCGLDTPGLETFRWKPTVSSGAWEEPANWEGAEMSPATPMSDRLRVPSGRSPGVDRCGHRGPRAGP